MSLLTANRVKSQKYNKLLSTHIFKTNEIKIRFIGLYTDISIECQYNNTYMNIYTHNKHELIRHYLCIRILQAQLVTDFIILKHFYIMKTFLITSF